MAGKDTVCDYLVSKGFAKFVFSDVIRGELIKEGIAETRANMQAKGNELREKFGSGFIAEKLVEKIKQSNSKLALVSGVRNPGEVEELKKQEGFFLISVDAPLELRYKRGLERKDSKDFVSFEEFKNLDARDKGLEQKESGQQNGKAMQMADFTIQNSGSEKELFEKVEEILEKIESKVPESLD